MADLSLAVNFDRFEKFLGTNIDKFPLLKSVNQKVNSIPKLAEYKARRPVTEF